MVNAAQEEQRHQVIERLVKEESVGRVDLSEIGFINPDTLGMIPIDLAQKYKIIPFSHEDDSLLVTMANPFNVHAQNVLHKVSDGEFKIFFTPEGEINEWLQKLYLHNNNMDDEAGDLLEPSLDTKEDIIQDENLSIETLEEEAYEAPAIR